MHLSDDSHPEASSKYANACILFRVAQMFGDKVSQGNRERAVHSVACLPQSAWWIIYESADRRGAGSTRHVSQGGNTSRQSGAARFVLRPLDFNDGPAFSLCESTPWLFLLCQLKRAAACESLIFRGSATPAFFFPDILLPCHFHL